MIKAQPVCLATGRHDGRSSIGEVVGLTSCSTSAAEIMLLVVDEFPVISLAREDCSPSAEGCIIRDEDAVNLGSDLVM